MLKKGDTVQLVQPLIIGNILTPAIVNDELQYLVEFVDSEGETQQRYFTEEQIVLTV